MQRSHASENSEGNFKKVSLEVKSRNDLFAAAIENGAMLSIADCWPLYRGEMAMLLELTGPPIAIKKTITTLQEMTGVNEVHEVDHDVKSTVVFIALEKPRICRSAEEFTIMCLDCPFDSTEVPSRWRFAARKTSDVGEIVARLGEGGIQAKIQDISPLDKNVTLTQKEKGIIVVAIERGYFDFPRKITLKDLGQLVGVEPASLSKILHSVE
jgi:predicted DNA binding protein